MCIHVYTILYIYISHTHTCMYVSMYTSMNIVFIPYIDIQYGIYIYTHIHIHIYIDTCVGYIYMYTISMYEQMHAYTCNIEVEGLAQFSLV